MGSGDTFTQAAYFKRLARMLRTSGHQRLPRKEEITKEIKKAEDVNFTQWFMNASSNANFETILAIHMARPKRR